MGVLKALVPALRCKDKQAHIFASQPKVHKLFMATVDSFLSLKKIPTDGLGLLAQALTISVEEFRRGIAESREQATRRRVALEDPPPSCQAVGWGDRRTQLGAARQLGRARLR